MSAKSPSGASSFAGPEEHESMQQQEQYPAVTLAHTAIQ
jgi:hypothetical protein